MILAQNRSKRTFQSDHEYRALGRMVMVGVSASACPVPWGLASQFLLPHSRTLALHWFSRILVPPKCFLALQSTPNEIKQSDCQTRGCQLFPVFGVLGSSKTEVWIRWTFLANSPHLLTVALSPPKTCSSQLELGCLELSTMNVIRQPSPSHPPKLYFQVPSLKFYPWPQQLILLFHAGTYLWLHDFLPLLK